jgi:hypothetical protein
MTMVETMWPRQFPAKFRHCEQSEAISTEAKVAIPAARGRFPCIAQRVADRRAEAASRKPQAAEFVALVWIASLCSQ